ncbi:hypothetical protein [Brevibacterium salitolerans]
MSEWWEGKSYGYVRQMALMRIDQAAEKVPQSTHDRDLQIFREHQPEKAVEGEPCLGCGEPAPCSTIRMFGAPTFPMD